MQLNVTMKWLDYDDVWLIFDIDSYFSDEEIAYDLKSYFSDGDEILHGKVFYYGEPSYFARVLSLFECHRRRSPSGTQSNFAACSEVSHIWKWMPIS